MARPLLHMVPTSRQVLHEEIVTRLQTLPVVLREVFIRSHYHGQSTTEISAELGIPENSINGILQDANEIFYRSLHCFRV